MNEFLKYRGQGDYLDDIDRAMLDLFDGEMKGIGGKERFDLYRFAAKHQATELYGDFLKLRLRKLICG